MLTETGGLEVSPVGAVGLVHWPRSQILSPLQSVSLAHCPATWVVCSTGLSQPDRQRASIERAKMRFMSEFRFRFNSTVVSLIKPLIPIQAKRQP